MDNIIQIKVKGHLRSYDVTNTLRLRDTRANIGNKKLYIYKCVYVIYFTALSDFY